MPVSDASAKRAAAWLEAWARAGLLGTDPEVVGFVADLIQFVGERTMDENGMELTSTGSRAELGGMVGRTGYEVAAEWRDKCKAAEARVRELEAEVARLREGLRPFADAGIPDNWPAECVLTWDAHDEPHDTAFVNYLPLRVGGGPTVGDYRRAAELLGTPRRLPVTATLTPDLLAHLAAVRDGACDDNGLLVLAERLDDVGMEQPTEYEEKRCDRCDGYGGWRKAEPKEFGGVSYYWSRCPVCDGKKTTLVPRPNPLRDRAELLRLQVRKDQLNAVGVEKASNEEDAEFCEILRREGEIVRRNPAWVSVSCPKCHGRRWVSRYDGDHLEFPCPDCFGGDLIGDNPTITRGFLDITLPHTLCWRECSACRGEGEITTSHRADCYRCRTTGIEPHPVLRAVLASPVGPWVRRVRVEGKEPGNGWWWRDKVTGDPAGREYLPWPVFNYLPGKPNIQADYGARFDTAEAAADALSLAVPRWARGAK